MALGVEAAGVATRTGGAVVGVVAGDRVMTHSLPLRAQGAWAEWFVAAASDVAPVPFEVAAALPVPTLTANQVLRGALGAGPGTTVLVHGAGGVTGTLMVRLVITNRSDGQAQCEGKIRLVLSRHVAGSNCDWNRAHRSIRCCCAEG